jgi:hypothetical protein
MVHHLAVNDCGKGLDLSILGGCGLGIDALSVSDTDAQKKANLRIGHFAKTPWKEIPQGTRESEFVSHFC